MAQIGKIVFRCFLFMLILLSNNALNPVIASNIRAQAVLYVSTEGTGSSCSQNIPCDLQTALATALGGDIIYLAGGIYRNPSPATEVVLVNLSITIIGGWNGQSGSLVVDPDLFISVIDGENARRGANITSGAGGAVLKGLTFNSGYHALRGGGISIDADPVTIENCSFINNSTDSHAGAIYLLTDRSATIKSSLFDSNQATNYGGAISSSQNSDLEIYDSTFVSNTSVDGGAISVDRGTLMSHRNIFNQNVGNQTVQVSLGSSGFIFVNNIITNSLKPGNFQPATGLSFYQTNTAFGQIYYNTFAGHSAAIACDYGEPIFLIINNIFAFNNTSISCVSPYLSVGYNLFYENTLNPIEGGEPVFGDPKFVDLENSDFHIGVGSAAIDVGGNINVSTDFEGDKRPSFAGYDIGADELCLQTYLPFVIR